MKTICFQSKGPAQRIEMIDPVWKGETVWGVNRAIEFHSLQISWPDLLYGGCMDPSSTQMLWVEHQDLNPDNNVWISELDSVPQAESRSSQLICVHHHILVMRMLVCLLPLWGHPTMCIYEHPGYHILSLTYEQWHLNLCLWPSSTTLLMVTMWCLFVSCLYETTQQRAFMNTQGITWSL